MIHMTTCTEGRHECHKCEGCGICLFEVGFKQDIEAALLGYPIFECLKCGKRNFWD